MRWALPTLSISLAVHAGIATALLWPRPAPAIDPPPRMAGETFELPAPETEASSLANASPSPDRAAAPAPIDVGDAPARPSPPSHASQAVRPSHQGRPSGGRAASSDPAGAPGATGTGGPYGAVGDRSAADVGKAFTFAFRQIASADPAWSAAPLGSAGGATVTITLDESGHVESYDVKGTPSAALSSSIQRTMTLIKNRPFVARSKSTKLALEANVTGEPGHDTRFGLGSEFPTDEGVAFFSLPIGRRIDMRVRRR